MLMSKYCQAQPLFGFANNLSFSATSSSRHVTEHIPYVARSAKLASSRYWRHRGSQGEGSATEDVLLLAFFFLCLPKIARYLFIQAVARLAVLIGCLGWVFKSVQGVILLAAIWTVLRLITAGSYAYAHGREMLQVCMRHGLFLCPAHPAPGAYLLERG